MTAVITCMCLYKMKHLKNELYQFIHLNVSK